MRVSIITVTFNSERYLIDCLNSVSYQDYSNIDHIIVDGKSTDSTISILNSQNKKLSKIVSEADQGIYDAMNKGIKLAEGDIIGFLNSDDIYFNNKIISKVVNLFSKNPELDACYADLVYTDPKNLSNIIRYMKSCKFKSGLFSRGWCPPHPTFFVRRSIYDRFGSFNLKYNIASDVELMMRFLEVNKINSLYVPELWVKMRLGGTTNKNLKNIILQNKEILSALKSHKISFNRINFFVHKFFSRSLQFLKKKY